MAAQFNLYCIQRSKNEFGVSKIEDFHAKSWALRSEINELNGKCLIQAEIIKSLKDSIDDLEKNNGLNNLVDDLQQQVMTAKSNVCEMMKSHPSEKLPSFDLPAPDPKTNEIKVLPNLKVSASDFAKAICQEEISKRAKLLNLCLKCEKINVLKEGARDTPNWSTCNRGLARLLWKHLRNKIINLSKIRLISCIQLASKLDSHSNFLRLSQGVTALKLIDFLKNQQHEYFFETLLFSEFSVCKVISFQMLITPLDCIEVLMSILNFQNISELRSIALDILDLVLIQGQQLLSKLQSFKFCSIPKSKSERLHGTNSMTLELDLLCLSSSIIVCALSYLNIEQAMSLHIVQKLSSLIYINSEKIILIAYIIRSIVHSC
ncbi:hypothetical protein KQX54_014120 [Cotesia glomerata]|uniref:Uncharacterized protein n=1 Tax=Cotesia glomerata TaxID=32391 RepID=A0AAV7IF09_COTGL|nr:hypothetical protein KQX54_014120 [Cotesia glomerata]